MNNMIASGFYLHNGIYVVVFENLLLVLLADPRDSETFRPLDMHHGMEVRVGVSKGAVCPSFI